MTPTQIDLARAALGLRDGRKTSCKNRFFCFGGAPDHAEWSEMVTNGEAMLRPAEGSSGLDAFVLTRIGAERALAPGELLDPEDFPTEPRA